MQMAPVFLLLLCACCSFAAQGAPSTGPSRERLMPTEVIVKLSPAAIAVDAGVRRSLDLCIRGLGISLTPLHQGTSDPDLATYFVATVAVNALDDVLAR